MKDGKGKKSVWTKLRLLLRVRGGNQVSSTPVEHLELYLGLSI